MDSSSGQAIHDPALRELAEVNNACVDCGAPNPDWVSINLGVFICIQCSGIHRSLGVHISKVRSITLDQLDPVDVAVLRRIGNERANRVWEHTLLDGWAKPRPSDSRQVKEQFIRAKYHWKGFIQLEPGAVPEGVTAEEFYSKALMQAVARDDLEGVLSALVKGADLRWQDKQGARGTALHVAAGAGLPECCAFLLQNGADPNSKNAEGMTPFDVVSRAAASPRGNRAEVLRYLLK
jgi:Arf-GAP with coiled-coil, ANK repeat and PH domain-containing protein